MASRRQKQEVVSAIRRGEYPMPQGRFERLDPRSHSERVRCVLCGATGFGPLNPRVEDLTGSSWQIMCLLDHDVKCRCGLSFRDAHHLSQHVAARVHPGRELMHGPLHTG